MRVVRVLPDVPAIDRAFDYLVPDALSDLVGVGTIVRIPLQGRRVRGWVVADHVEAPAGVRLRPLGGVTGHGPAAPLHELAAWAAWRWAGRQAHFLGTASPPAAVRGLPAARRTTSAPGDLGAGRARSGPTEAAVGELVADALARGGAVVRLPPAVATGEVVLAVARALEGATTLVVTPTHADAERVAATVRGGGRQVATLPGGWALAAAGVDVVVGARAAAWAPATGLGAIVVLDEHDEAHASEAAPTWHARDVAIERARRAGVACLLVSACPSQEALTWAPTMALSRRAERQGWPIVEVLDRSGEDPLRADLYSDRLVDALRSGRRVLCILNRTGRARLLACRSCATLARCEVCDAAVGTTEEGTLVCGRCGAERPAVCTSCGSTRLRVRRLGVTRAREDLERLAGTPVAEVSGSRAGGDPAALAEARVVVGTEAALHRVGPVEVVAFLDLDAELLAPRARAAEEAMALLARAARLLGGRDGGGRLLLQTKLAGHEVVQAALQADPDRVAVAEGARRRDLRLPPTTAVALVSGEVAETYAEGLRGRLGVEVLGPVDGSWLVRAGDHSHLCDALAANPRPAGRLRVSVDPLRF